MFVGVATEKDIQNITGMEIKMEKKILIIDDMIFTRKCVRDIFEEYGFCNIVEAGTAKAAIKTFLEEKPYLVILDISLPDCDDLSVLKMIYEINPEQKVVISSAVNQYVVMNEAKQLGALEYLIKPFTEEQFEQVLKPILED